ncbi:hypothetical protein V502_06793 [Pseudogymnoascus sp. VKM F-4520 (FW-2644)]|nr:hypothetical protein V502_06793 [Pseudogymnoascus sp. VKM F-4520 (FW-2644)]
MASPRPTPPSLVSAKRLVPLGSPKGHDGLVWGFKGPEASSAALRCNSPVYVSTAEFLLSPNLADSPALR